MANPMYFTVVRGFLQVFVCTFGIIGNGLSALVWSRPNMRSSINCILLGLAVADTMFLICQLLMIGISVTLPYFNVENWYENVAWPLMYPYGIVTQVAAQTASAFFTVAISLERYIAVKKPLLARRVCTVKLALGISIGITIFSIAFAIPEYFNVRVETNEVYEKQEWVEVTENSETHWKYVKSGKMHREYSLESTCDIGDFCERFQSWGIPIVNLIIPFTLLLILNIGIFFEVRKASRLRQNMTQSQLTEVSIAKMLLCVVLMFGICYVPFSVHFFYRALFYFDSIRIEKVMQNVLFFGELTTSINSAGNFVIYCAMNEKFRRTLSRICCFTRHSPNYGSTISRTDTTKMSSV